ncbi:MAG: hypothetical protein EOO89_27015 [Pedobacter sp.]|nr:MAG: hypothetical protein EOO89_27015 [Pedobacter sp.]
MDDRYKMATKRILIWLVAEESGGIRDYAEELWPDVQAQSSAQGWEPVLILSPPLKTSGDVRKIVKRIRELQPCLIHVQHEFGLFGSKVPFRYRFPELARLLSDIAPVVAPIQIISGLIYFGPAALPPTDEAAIFALGNSLPAETYTFPMASGLNKTFCIALPPGKGIASVIDQTTLENLKDLFKVTHFNVSGLNHNICTMQNLLPFTVSHNLLISIVNV